MSNTSESPGFQSSSGVAPQDRALRCFAQAVALHRAGNLEAARGLYSEVLALSPQHADALHLLGLLAFQRRQFAVSVDLISRAIEVAPGNAAFHSNRGLALNGLGRHEAAIADFEVAIGLKPDYVNALFNRGVAFSAAGNPAAAISSYDRAIAVSPNSVEAWSNRGVALKTMGRLEEAVASFDRALALAPLDAGPHSNRGNALKEMGRFSAAVESYDRSLAIRPDEADVHYNRGLALKELGSLREALDCYDRAIAIDPGHAEAHFNKSLALLLLGEFELGWELYEWRWKRRTFTSPARDFVQPLWLGKERVEGKSILLHGEQGLGDSIQFCRYACAVAALGARVILEVPVPLVPLLRTLAGVSEVVATSSLKPDFDLHCPMMSLPLALRASVPDIPFAGPYLYSDPVKVAMWSESLGPRTLPRVGLVWSGSEGHKNDLNRSIPLVEFSRVVSGDCEFISLQKEVRQSDMEALRSTPGIRCLDAEMNDFSDTAALCELMDVVVCVDTSVAHVAGALGKQVWILVPWMPDWRWLLKRSDSPWYSSASIYRQHDPGDWTSVLESVRSDLALLAR